MEILAIGDNNENAKNTKKCYKATAYYYTIHISAVHCTARFWLLLGLTRHIHLKRIRNKAPPSFSNNAI